MNKDHYYVYDYPALGCDVVSELELFTTGEKENNCLSLLVTHIWKIDFRVKSEGLSLLIKLTSQVNVHWLLLFWPSRCGFVLRIDKEIIWLFFLDALLLMAEYFDGS